MPPPASGKDPDEALRCPRTRASADGRRPHTATRARRSRPTTAAGDRHRRCHLRETAQGVCEPACRLHAVWHWGTHSGTAWSLTQARGGPEARTPERHGLRPNPASTTSAPSGGAAPASPLTASEDERTPTSPASSAIARATAPVPIPHRSRGTPARSHAGPSGGGLADGAAGGKRTAAEEPPSPGTLASQDLASENGDGRGDRAKLPCATPYATPCSCSPPLRWRSPARALWLRAQEPRNRVPKHRAPWAQPETRASHAPSPAKRLLLATFRLLAACALVVGLAARRAAVLPAPPLSETP